MYRGFNLEFSNYESSEFLAIEDKEIDEYKSNIKKYRGSVSDRVWGDIDSYINKEGTVEAGKIMAEWFPQKNYDIFLSHSDMDEKLAIRIAIWLKKEFGLSCFIDSLVWGYSDNLLRAVDDEYCFNEKKGIYYYENRNITRSHVGTILSVSLMQMIDSSSVCFFKYP